MTVIKQPWIAGFGIGLVVIVIVQNTPGKYMYLLEDDGRRQSSEESAAAAQGMIPYISS